MLRSKWFALLLTMTLAPPAEAQDFCSVIKRAVADVPNDFRSIRGRERTDDEWDSVLAIPGMTNCKVSYQFELGFALRCEALMSTRAAAEAKMKEVETLIRQCYPRGVPVRYTIPAAFGFNISDLPELGKAYVGASLLHGYGPLRVAVSVGGQD